MSLNKITTFVEDKSLIWNSLDNVHRKAIYRKRIMPNHLEGIKSAYIIYKTLLNFNGNELNKDLKEAFMKLTKILSFLYDKELVSISCNDYSNIKLTIESIDKMLQELESLDMLIKEDIEVNFDKIEAEIEKDCELKAEKIIELENDDAEEEIKNEDYMYFAGYKESDSFYIVSRKEDICKFSRIHYVFVPEKITGSYEVDKALSSTEMVYAFNADKTTKDYYHNVVTEKNTHIEISHMINSIGCTLVYLKNSSSVRSNDFFWFDEQKVSDCLMICEGYAYSAKRLLLHAKQDIIKRESL